MNWEKEAKRWRRAYWKAVDDGVDDEFLKRRKELKKARAGKKSSAKHKKIIGKASNGAPVTILESVNQYLKDDDAQLLLL